ncbi:MAG TPA: efflux RND transporter periplasmic adaptor subunit [Spirochaetota bacterium]|nr:efflux RND transporter periplasmic adaptor subunit [Spirochaetota bacterium]HPN14120.1 efflux RND transporter periplasmic adaptor subunit [Spirochaetota bacterium]
MQKITRKKIIAFGIVIAVILLFATVIRSCSKGSGDKFEYDTVDVGTVQKSVSATGTLDITNGQYLLCKTTGAVEKVYVDFNQEVKRGQLLATISAQEVEQKLSKIAAQLESVKLELNIAKEDLESKKELFRENLISEKGMDRATSNYKTVQLKYRQAQVDYNITLEQRNNSRIVSPIDGIVIAVKIVPNSPVTLNTNTFIIAPTLKKMTLTISIDESDIGAVNKNQDVVFSVSAFPDKSFKGEINQVHFNPVVKGGLVTYDSIVSCDNSELLLKPGMTATATIIVGKKDKVLRVQNQALLVNPGETPAPAGMYFVWRKVSKMSGKLPVERVQVDIGLRGDNYTEIKKNLKKGDQILIKYLKGGKGAK